MLKDSSETASFQYQYKSPEAKEIGVTLGEYLADVYLALEEYLQGLSDTCSAAVSLQEYNSLLPSAKELGCTTDTPDGYEDAEKTIAEAAAKCKNVDNVEDLAILITEVEKAQVKVQRLDKLIADNSKLCASNAISKDTCASNRKRIVGQLKDILSNHEIAKYEHLLRNAFFNTKKIVDTCMDSQLKHLKAELDAASKTINDCLDN